MTYVFSPVIDCLKKHGYEAGVDLDAATYDWRFAPGALQTRERYFDRMLVQLEQMAARSPVGDGVVLLGHSMGNKVIQYFLNYAEAKRGRGWLDRHVHTWLAL